MRKRFEKRPLGIVMAAVMASQLCACGNAQKSDLQETEKSNEPVQETSSAVENTTGEGQTETLAVVSGEGENGIEVIDAIEYDYEQELNIIDDNY
ncbi:MAG: hypothetical protein K2G55_17740, partial [Lachnospiraceae bacterium]|nr:hypothetical protein [Lachnospiraceae bacterium]